MMMIQIFLELFLEKYFHNFLKQFKKVKMIFEIMNVLYVHVHTDFKYFLLFRLIYLWYHNNYDITRSQNFHLKFLSLAGTSFPPWQRKRTSGGLFWSRIWAGVHRIHLRNKSFNIIIENWSWQQKNVLSMIAYFSIKISVISHSFRCNIGGPNTNWTQLNEQLEINPARNFAPHWGLLSFLLPCKRWKTKARRSANRWRRFIREILGKYVMT